MIDDTILSLLSYTGIVVCLTSIPCSRLTKNESFSKAVLLNKGTLFVVNELSDEVILASRNIEGVKVILPNEVNVLDLATYKNMVATEDAVKKIEEVLI